MRVRFIKAWQTYKVGQIIEPAALLREWLLQCKYVEIVREEPGIETAQYVDIAREEPGIETAVVAPTEHAALRVEKPKRKRGRPRKMPV